MAYGRIFAKKVKYDGYTFDSEMECLYYKELKEREEKGEVENIKVHHSYILQEEFVANNGRKHKAITYEPDFVFYDKIENRTRYIDIKGMVLEEFALKWKMFDYKLRYHDNHYLEVLKYSKTTSWVNIEDYKKIMKTKKQELIAEKNYYKNIVMKQEHDKVMAERKAEREIKRLKELLALTKPTKVQLTRLNELKEKYPNVK